MSSQAKWLVGLLIVVLGIILGSKYCGAPEAAGGARPTTTAPGEEAAPKAGKKSRKIDADDIPVIVKVLSRPREGETFDRNRSLFDYAQSPEELADIKAKAEAAAAQAKLDEEERQRILAELNARQAAEAAARAQAAAEQAARDAEERRLHPPKPVPPKFPYEYIGVIGPKDDAYAILRGPDQKMIYAKAGDVLDHEFRIERVAKFVLDLTYTEPQFASDIGQVQRTFESAGAGAASAAGSHK